MNPSPKTLHFFTLNYPYGQGEPFVHNELHSLCNQFNEVIIYPIKYNNLSENLTQRTIPQNAKVITINQNYNFKKLLTDNLFNFMQYFLLDFILDKRSRFKKLFHIKYQIGYFIAAINIKKQVEKYSKLDYDDFFYSYWMHEGALALSILKKNKKINNFNFKCHGFDVYNEVHQQGFIPFRMVNYQLTRHIITISKANKKYIDNLYSKYSKKLKVIYMGTNDYGQHYKTAKKKSFLIFSCSNIIPLKRVEYIPKILKNIDDVNIEWIHAGDGINEKKVKLASKEMPSNIKYKFLGRLPNDEIYEFYKNHSIDIFLHLSESEGLPVSMMEAISFGVPIMACNVGGVNEIVTKDTGILLSKNLDTTQIAYKIKSLLINKQPKFNSNEIRKFWAENFYHERNVKDLIKLLNYETL